MTSTARLSTSAPLPFREKFSYGLSDAGYNLIFNVSSLYLMYYYTDVVKLDLAAVGVLFLVVRIVDAVAGPVAGIIIDRTRSKWGRARPWFLRMSVPFAVIMVLTFSVPDSTTSVQLVWVYVTYTLMNLAAAMANVPINAILPSLTNSPDERTKANVYRNVLGQVGVIAGGLLALPLVQFIGGVNPQVGWTGAFIVLGVVSAGFYLLAFKNTRERVKFDEGAATPFIPALKSTVASLPWWLLFITNLVLFIGIVTKGSTIVYFFKYTLGDENLSAIANTTNAVAMILGMIFIAPLARRFGRKRLVMIGLAVSIVGQVVLAVAAGTTSVGMTLAGLAIAAFGLGGAQSLIFVLFADVVDYGEWRFGVRAQGLIAGSTSLGVQFGAGIAGALATAVLATGGFVPGVAQSASSLNAIDINLVWIPIAALIIAIVLLAFYRVEKVDAAMKLELAERRTRSIPIA